MTDLAGTGCRRWPHCPNILGDRNAATHNPVKAWRQPEIGKRRRQTPCPGDHQARSCSMRLTETPQGLPVLDAYQMWTTVRATSATAPFSPRCFSTHCGERSWRKLKVKDFLPHTRKGVLHSEAAVGGKKAISAAASWHPCVIHEYLIAAATQR